MLFQSFENNNLNFLGYCNIGCPQVSVPIPDYGGRLEILRMYVSKVAAAPELDVETLARSTTGFTGADLESMVNQAALK